MFRKLLISGVMALTALGASLTAQAQNVKLAITDLVGMEELQREFGPFKKELERVTKTTVEFLPVTNRTAGLEALSNFCSSSHDSGAITLSLIHI